MGDLNELVDRFNTVIAEEADEYEADAADAYERGERPDLWEREVTVPVAWVSQAAAALTSLIAERDGLREALEPFAEAGKAVEGAFGLALFPDDAVALGCTWTINGERRSITWSDFRRARTALSLDTNKGDGV